MKRGFVFAIHNIAGLFSGLFLLLISLSGAVLVFHEELDSLKYPKIITETNKQVLSIDSCYNYLQKQYPRAQVSNCHLPESISSPFLFTIYDSSYKNGAEALQVFIHPQNGTILKTRSSKHNLMNWIAVMHNSFHLGKTGEWMFGFFALVFVLSTVTGLMLYRKNILAALTFSRKFFQWKNLHQLVGVYALLFNLMIGITGFWMQRYVFKKSFYATNDWKPILRPSPPLFFSFDSSFQSLRDQYPDFTGYVIYFTGSKKGKTAIYGSRGSNSFIHSKKFADAIFLDSNGRVAQTRFVNEISPSDRYDIINSQVHFGQYGGWPVKIIYALFGLTGSILSITGFLMWVKRRKRRNKMELT